ncbi:MAG: GntR family transcriptional regulator [Desulfobacterales bacterium]|nr:MAG: GntR family transcriptional regulator [Desulfobacterales bacterium]
MLNTKSPIPLYHQLADILLVKIRSGAYPPGSKIPSEHRLSAQYHIGRPTARQATDVLVRKGILVRKRGSGTFVREENEEVDLFSLAGTISSFHKKGILVKTQLLQKVRLKIIKNDPENPFANKTAYFFSRISRVESEPVLIEDIYLHDVLFAGIDRIHLAGRSLSQVVDEHYFLRPYAGKQNFRIGYLAGKRARALGVAEVTPILTVKRFLHFEPAKNAIYSELYCRTDRFVFSQTLGGMTDEDEGLL